MTIGTMARIIARAPAFFAVVTGAGWRYMRKVRRVPEEQARVARARWLHDVCRRELRWQNVHITIRGSLPERGLIVANHLSYLDIMVLSAALPCVFVSKKEVVRWPIFGTFAKLSGTLFIDRARRRLVGRIAAQMREVLAAGLPLVVFPEGTSTAGDTVLPFKTSLFEPVIELACPVTAAALSYRLIEGSVRDEIHWWGNKTLPLHLLNLFGKRRIDATIHFGESRPRTGNRKAIAQELRAEVCALLARDPSLSL